MNSSEEAILNNLYKYITDDLPSCVDEELFAKTSFEELYLAGNSSDKLSEFAPFAEGYEKEVIYICENFVLH
ncbi:hypothetical protein [Peribacillus loiseleuriae]|uniref:hypothetical protein n=1 Tax=Peribacillus loiseleuriae TaxID=1679170 RepID=UPI003CFCF9C9